MLDKNKVKQWYEWGMWSKSMVKNAVAKGRLSPSDYKEITGEDYTKQAEKLKYKYSVLKTSPVLMTIKAE